MKEKAQKSKATGKGKSKGWIKFCREELDLPMFENLNLMKVWLWCRTKATHKKWKYKVTHPKRKTIKVELQPGQFIFGKYKAARRLGMAPSTFYRQMLKLQELGELELRADCNHTLVTIVNWDSYESDGKIPDRKNDLKSKSKKGGPQKPKKADRKTKLRKP